jgi:hypothetical protein
MIINNTFLKLRKTIAGLANKWFDRIVYTRNCACGASWNNNNTNYDPLQILHFLFDYLIRLGVLDPIELTQADLLHQGIAVCPLGRGINAQAFAYMVNVSMYYILFNIYMSVEKWSQNEYGQVTPSPYCLPC